MSTDPWTTEKWLELERSYVQGRQLRGDLRVKRLMDFATTVVGLITLLPVLALIALAIRVSSLGPVLFRQKRLGKLGRPFTVYKFRTMIDGAIHQGAGLATFRGDPRVTRFGKLLREYHLDELPQLLNVLLGQMSLVGPRPVLVSALQTYSDWEKRRLLMPPGITGWQQINGGARNDVDARIRLDIWYVENWTWWLDLQILLRTIGVVIRKEGVYGEDGWQSGRVVKKLEIE
jgi:lipopolysaccharide/colanic/teichoic acid biosynthesis glycosyltransferase